MQIKVVDNQNSKVNFKSQNDAQIASAFVNMNDDQLKDIAYITAVNEKDNKKSKKTIMATFYAMPIVGTIASGILPATLTKKYGLVRLQNASLGQRAVSAGRTASSWALILSMVGAYNVVKRAAVDDSKSLKKFDQNHPVLSFLTDIGLILGGLVLAGKGIQKLADKKPALFIKLKRKIIQGKQSLDKTKLNKDILPILSEGASRLSEKAPIISKIGRVAIANSVLIVFAVGLYKTIKHSIQENRKIEKNYIDLKNAQLKTAKHLTNSLAVERDILVQEQKDLKKELRHEKHKHKHHHPEPDDEKVIDK